MASCIHMHVHTHTHTHTHMYICTYAHRPCLRAHAHAHTHTHTHTACKWDNWKKILCFFAYHLHSGKLKAKESTRFVLSLGGATLSLLRRREKLSPLMFLEICCWLVNCYQFSRWAIELKWKLLPIWYSFQHFSEFPLILISYWFMSLGPTFMLQGVCWFMFNWRANVHPDRKCSPLSITAVDRHKS